MKRGIILFIVEGPSDHTALIPFIEERLIRMKKFRVTVKEMHGDILTEYINGTRQFQVKPSNVKGEIKKIIQKYLNQPSIKAEQISQKDIIKIYYVTDTDYCFFGDKDYHKNKMECLNKIFNFNDIEIYKNRKIPFETIFFSKNLEHIIANDMRDFSDKEKEKIAIKFSEKSLIEDNFFIEFFYSKDIKKWNSYKNSYENIKKYKGRACNMNNFIEEYEIKRK